MKRQSPEILEMDFRMEEDNVILLDMCFTDTLGTATNLFKRSDGVGSFNIWVDKNGAILSQDKRYDVPANNNRWHHIVITQDWEGTHFNFDGLPYNFWYERLIYWLVWAWKVLIGKELII